MTAGPEALAARMEALETRLAYQERTIEELNTALTAQWDAIDTLQRRMAGMLDRMAEAEARAAVLAGPAEPPPPHY